MRQRDMEDSGRLVNRAAPTLLVRARLGFFACPLENVVGKTIGHSLGRHCPQETEPSECAICLCPLQCPLEKVHLTITNAAGVFAGRFGSPPPSQIHCEVVRMAF